MPAIMSLLNNLRNRRAKHDAQAPTYEGGRRDPDFICFGSQKAGTRWLFDQLNARSDVWMPPIKEITFLDGNPLKPVNMQFIESGKLSDPACPRPGDDARKKAFTTHFSIFDRETSGTDWYRTLFGFCDDRITGDISPSYCALGPQHVREYGQLFPDTKFIFLIRDPVSRFWSQVCHAVRKGKIASDGLDDPGVIRGAMESEWFIDKSYPSRIWQTWSSQIAPERIRFWFFDDIVSEPQQVVDEICNFLSIVPGPGAIPAHYNRKRNNQKYPMSDSVRALIQEKFTDELERCAEIFGGHAVRWRDEARAVSLRQGAGCAGFD